MTRPQLATATAGVLAAGALAVGAYLVSVEDQAQALAPCAILRPLAEACADPKLPTPRCGNDYLYWAPVVDEDLSHYLVEEQLPDRSVTLETWTTTEVGLAVGCRDEPRLMRVFAVDLIGNPSQQAAECLYAPGRVWDCVVDVDPVDPCRRICDAWEDCVFDDQVFNCCTASHLEPLGCQLEQPPIGGPDIWSES